jgi:general secretion pathway protein D
VRVRSKEKARVHVGDRVPVISSTIVGQGTNAPVTAEQIQYLDVGIKIEVEPTVHADDTIAIKINLDVSTLGASKKSASGNEVFQVGTRNVTTVLRLRDEETQALMGLISDDDSQSGAGLPYVGEVPVLDRVFGNKKTRQESKELVLLITPHLVRGVDPTDATLAEFWSGTEAAVRTRTPFVLELAAKDKLATAGGAAAASTLAIAAPAAAVGAAAPPLPMLLSWQGPASVKPGEEFVIELRARSEGPLKGASVQLRYDPEQLEVLAVEDGGYFTQVGGAAVFTPRVDPGLGVVFATIGASGAASTQGDGGLLKLRVKSRKPVSSTSLQIGSVVAVDPSNRSVPIEGSVPLQLTSRP